MGHDNLGLEFYGLGFEHCNVSLGLELCGQMSFSPLRMVLVIRFWSCLHGWN